MLPLPPLSTVLRFEYRGDELHTYCDNEVDGWCVGLFRIIHDRGNTFSVFFNLLIVIMLVSCFPHQEEMNDACV